MAISKIDPAGLDLTGDAAFDTDTLVVDSTNNRVGIGTDSPARQLTVKATSGAYIQLCDDTSGTGVSDGFQLIQTGVNADITNRENGPLRIGTNNTERMRIDSSGNVGIGDTPVNHNINATTLHVDGGSNASELRLTNTTTGTATSNGFHIAQVGNEVYLVQNENANMRFYTNATERMRIDSSGSLLVGKSTADDVNTGARIANIGFMSLVRDGGRPLWLNRLTNDGAILEFAKNSTSVGRIGHSTYGIDIDGTSGYVGLNPNDSLDTGTGVEMLSRAYTATPRFRPTGDNKVDIGASSTRFDDIYATNGTIQTSDQNEKQDIASLTTAEMAVAARLANQFKTFRWIDSVTAKGDNARTHTGIIAQDVQQAFTDEGLDAGDYALFISTTWWETQTEVPAVEAVEAQDAVYDEDGNLVSEAVEAVEAKDAYTRTYTYETADEAPEGATERTRMGIRYPELLSFMQAYNDQRMTSIEARLDALEAN